MVAKIEFVDEATIAKVFCRKDSEGVQSASNCKSEDDDDMSDEGNNTQEDNDDL